MNAGAVLRLAVAAGFLVLGTWILGLAWRRRLHRAFFVLMACETLVYGTLPFEDGSPGWTRANWYGQLALPWAAVNFALVVWRGQVHGARVPVVWRLARWTTLAGATACIVVYTVRHAWLEAPWPNGVTKGALPLTAGIAALALALAQRRLPRGRDGSALLLFAFAFALHPAFQGAFLSLEGLTQRVPPYLVLGPLALAFVAATAVVLWRTAIRLGRASRLRDVRHGAVVIAVAGATGFVPGAAVWLGAPEDVAQSLLQALGSMWNVAFAVTLAYAVARYCPFGLTSRLRNALREGTFLSLVGAVFFVAETILKDLLQDLVPELGGTARFAASIALAATVAVLLLPVRRACARVALRAVPHLSPAGLHKRRVEIYRAAARAAQQDGRLTSKERSALESLAQSLGLAPHETRGFEHGH